jgi:hypothetical protein
MNGNVSCSRHPEVKWAQRIDKVYITVQLPDAKDAKVNLEPDGIFTFSGSAGTNLYELKLDLNDKVNVEVMHYHHVVLIEAEINFLDVETLCLFFHFNLTG